MADILHDLAWRLACLVPDTVELSTEDTSPAAAAPFAEAPMDMRLPLLTHTVRRPSSTPPDGDPLDFLFTDGELDDFVKEINAQDSELPVAAAPPKRSLPFHPPRLIRLDTQTLAACSAPIPMGPSYAARRWEGPQVKQEEPDDFIPTVPSYSPIQAFSRPPTPPRMPSTSAPLRTFGRMMRLPKTPCTPSALSPPPSPPTSTRTRRRVTFEPLRRSTRARQVVIKPSNGMGFECAELPLHIKMCEIRSASFVDMSNETLVLYLKGTGDTHDFEGYYLSDEFAAVCALPGNEYFADVLQQAQRAVSLALARYFKHNPWTQGKLSTEKYVALDCRKPDKRRRVVLYKPPDYRYAGRVLRFK